MAKTTINIPKMDAAIMCRNEREKRAARIFVREMHDTVEAAVRGESYGLGAVDESTGWTHWICKDLEGNASAFYFMDMLEESISSVEISEAMRAMYEDEMSKAAGDDPAAAEDAAADMYMDAVKADAAYCLGIDEGSDEWYELMNI